jgi:hypothetical protein
LHPTTTTTTILLCFRCVAYLANGVEFQELILGNPIASQDQVIAQNGHVRLRSAKRDKAQRPKRGKDLRVVKK